MQDCLLPAGNEVSGGMTVATIAEALALAVERHQAGNVDYAEEVYRRVLQADPDNVDAWCYLATACLDSSRLPEAVEHYRQALRLRPDHAAAHSDLGIALAQLGRTEEAAACFREAIRLRSGPRRGAQQPRHRPGPAWQDRRSQGLLPARPARQAGPRRCPKQPGPVASREGVTRSGRSRPRRAGVRIPHGFGGRPSTIVGWPWRRKAS